MRGLSLCLSESAAADSGPAVLRFDALQRLGLVQIRPDSGLPRNAFTPLDDATMIALLIRAGRASSRNVLFDALVEAAANGLRVLGMIHVGIPLVLKDADGGKAAVEVPACA